jgi:hypothetical protein
MKEYQIYYEYNDINGLVRKVHCCTVYNDYNKADNELSDILSDLEGKGCTNVAGDIIEL